ncbi:MAG: hypothetical protein ACI8WI_002220 [Pseudoalteromonas distincta]
MSNNETIASRFEFVKQFDELLTKNCNSYRFINGAHGIGKSTFCDTYSPLNDSLEHFATYCFSQSQKSKNAVQLAQPIEFFNWLNMQVSKLINGTPIRTDNYDYHRLIKETEQLLSIACNKYDLNKKVGILFIDGLDEISRHDPALLSKFIGLLPIQLPKGLIIVLAAPNYEQFEAQLGQRLNKSLCISLPPLKYNSAQSFCYTNLYNEFAVPKTVNLICERAQGHPLYLRYLIDLVNSGLTKKELSDFPLIDGTIRNYYDLLWSQLKNDEAAVNLLAIVARLRWGIPISFFSEILNKSEQAILISTHSRIKHLLLNENETTVYHSSFSDFLVEKTQLLEKSIQLRLFEFCEKNQKSQYGLLNLIYHGLKIENDDKSHVILLCNQSWVDKCVLQGVEPDTLQIDIHKTLEAATLLGDLAETVRILLLSQRINFRYSVLFAQSASLTAGALISIGKQEEVLQHVVRYGQLIIPPQESFKIVLHLSNEEANQEALNLTRTTEMFIEDKFENLLSGDGIPYDEFMNFFSLYSQLFMLKTRLGDESAYKKFVNFQLYWSEVISSNAKNKEYSDAFKNEMVANSQATAMCLLEHYVPISELRKIYRGPISDYTGIILSSIPIYFELCRYYGLTANRSILTVVFNDLLTIIAECGGGVNKLNSVATSALLTLNAPKEIIETFSKEIEELSSFTFIGEDGITSDEYLFIQNMSDWRLKAYAKTCFKCPNFIPFTNNNWEESISSICKIVAWCSGKARKYNQSSDAKELENVWDILNKSVIDNIKFVLSEREQWQDSYNIPEGIFPLIYKELAETISQSFENKISYLINHLNTQFDTQYGIYSEGFRRILKNTIECLTRKKIDSQSEDLVFNLVHQWNKYVSQNLKNRYELIPELLEIIALYKKLDAQEEAKRTYERVLSLSMGPSWYKEDQFGLCITALESLSTTSNLKHEVIKDIAGILDAASGEMTFQRFVRYAKRDLIGALCVKGKYKIAVDYFITQTYGTLEQMHIEVTRDNIDRLNELRGSRFPGNALDEQDCIVLIVKNIYKVADWQLCWALLECFQFGDDRHYSSFTQAYGLILNNISDDQSSVSKAFDRLEIICESEFNDELSKAQFINTIFSIISEGLREQFETKFQTELTLINEIEKEEITDNDESLAPNADVHKDENLGRNSDDMVIPGIFGKQSVTQIAEKLLDNAESLLRRNNFSSATSKILAGMEAMQGGGWTIWGESLSTTSRSRFLLAQTTDSVPEIVKLFSSLILNETNTQRWQIAEGLVDWLGKRSSHDIQNKLLKYTIEHINIIVGDTSEYITSYTKEKSNNKVGSSLEESLTQLLCHTLNHPAWLRREKAAELTSWLSKSYPSFIKFFSPKAFSMDSGSHSDIICGAIELIPFNLKLWDQLADTLDFESILNNCRHTGRYSVLTKLANKAVIQESQSAQDALNILRHRFNKYNSLNHDEIELPEWAETIKYEWDKLVQYGAINNEVVAKAEKMMREICSPLPIEKALELEELLAEGYSSSTTPPQRWKDKVFYVFQVALTDNASEKNYEYIGSLFRQYNPNSLTKERIINFNSPVDKWFKSNKITPVHEGKVYLDYCERLLLEGELKFVRLTAYIAESQQSIPLISGRFLSTEQINQSSVSDLDTCANVVANPAYFGGFTPANPAYHFMQITNINSSDITRGYWKSGRVLDDYKGAPMNEGCFLAINEKSFYRAINTNIIWRLEIDFKTVAHITYN